MGGLGIAGINAWLKEHGTVSIPEPIRQDGPGYRAVIDLPFGVTATQVIERRDQLASGLRRPLGAVWPEPEASEHAGRLVLWVGREDVSKAKAPPWPLLKGGQVDVFRPFPWAVSPQGRKVDAHMAYHNWLIGSVPRQGKTGAVRVLACAVALDPLAEMWVHELKGTGDLDARADVSHRFVSGIDDDSIAYAAESLELDHHRARRRAGHVRARPRRPGRRGGMLRRRGRAVVVGARRAAGAAVARAVRGHHRRRGQRPDGRPQGAIGNGVDGWRQGPWGPEIGH
jgi:DNA segregation ATPase FtsK/SpoIIIE, S-DNA-T family